MGGLISRLRAKPSTKELLEDLEKEIEALEEYKRSTEQQHKRIVGSLIFYFILLFILGAGIFLVYYFPLLTTTKEKLIYSIPLWIVPILFFLFKRFLHWYFAQKIKYNEENLLQLKRRRRSLLEFAMETETYKVVKELLEKYDPEYHKKVFETRAIEAPPSTPVPVKGTFGDLEFRKRASPVKTLSHVTPGQTLTLNTGAVRSPVPQMPRPVLPRERTLIDRIVDYMVGDGPSNRYALICRQCQSHNGMALREEFEFIAFRCCYCFHWNPPRSQQPPPPRLALQAGGSSTPLVTEPVSPSEASSSSSAKKWVGWLKEQASGSMVLGSSRGRGDESDAQSMQEDSKSMDDGREIRKGSESPSVRRRVITSEPEIQAVLEEDTSNHIRSGQDSI